MNSHGMCAFMTTEVPGSHRFVTILKSLKTHLLIDSVFNVSILKDSTLDVLLEELLEKQLERSPKAMKEKLSQDLLLALPPAVFKVNKEKMLSEIRL